MVFSVLNYAQNQYNIDDKKSEELFELFYKVNEKDTIEGFKLAKMILKEFKKREEDTSTILDGYTLLIESDLHNHKKYIDTIEYYSSFLDSNLFYPANGYFSAAQEYSLRKKFNNSLKLYFKAMELSEMSGNNYIENLSNMNIGLIKLERLNDNKEALDIFYKLLLFFQEDKYRFGYPYFYSQLLFNFTEAYNRAEKLDSVKKYISIGRDFLKKNKVENFTGYFDFADGIYNYKKNDLDKSLTLLKNSEKDLKINNDFANLLINYYYRSKIYKEREELLKYNIYSNRIDSIFDVKPMFILQIRDHFNELKEFYKANKNESKQLLYLNKLYKIDSIYNKDFRDITRNFDAFDSDEIEVERSQLYESILKEKRNKKNTLIASISIIFLTLLLLALYVKKYFHQKKLFNKLVNQDSEETISSSKIDLTDKLEKEILQKLDYFEENEKFLEKDLLIQDVAKKYLGTNSKYLRQILSKFKGKNFTNYINDLRIDWFTNKIKTDSKYKNYTLIVFAKDSGFSTYSTFARAFEKRTGLKPKYFVNQLLKLSNSRN